MNHIHFWIPFPHEPEWYYCLCGDMIRADKVCDDERTEGEKTQIHDARITDPEPTYYESIQHDIHQRDYPE